MSCILKKSVVSGKARTLAPLRVLTVTLLAAGLTSNLWAATPDLDKTLPRGGKRGTELKVTLHGARLQDAQQIYFHEPGITTKDLKALDDKKVEATFVIAPDCRLGEHHMRLRCASGMSYARTFWVSQFDNVAETEPNSEFESPQQIPVNVTVEGEAKPEDVDFYKIALKKGERISVEMEALRINNRRQAVSVDPYVAILDKNRNALVASDDSALLKQESIVSIIAPEDGEYIVEVRDSAYDGTGYYRAHIGHFPRPLAVYPAGGKAGSEIEVTLYGDPKGPYKTKVKLPDQPTDRYEVFGPHEGLLPPSGNVVRVSAFDNVNEAGANDSIAELKDAEAKALPLAFNGVLEKEGDNDYFKFTAKKDQNFRFRSHANKLGSPVDTVLYIHDAAGKGIGSSDDADGSSDSRIDFKAPADGEYYVRVRDMLNRGGDTFFYRVESEPRDPSVVVSMPEQIRRDNQYWKQMDIPQGGNFATVVNVTRENYSGELKFDLPKLPPGVTFTADPIPANQSSFPIVFHAKADAPIGGELVKLHVRNVDPKKPVDGKYVQQLDFIRGNPNGTLYYSSDSDLLPVSVVEKAPFSVSIEKPAIPIVRNGSLPLKIKAQREEGFNGKITLRMVWRPPGISGPSTITMDEKTSETTYLLEANANAEVHTWKIAMLAESDTPKGKVTLSTDFTELKVEEPYVDMKINLTTTKQGEDGAMLCEVGQLREFEGKAKVTLLGLPAKSSAEPIEITKGDTQITIPIKTEVDTPVGQHKSVFCTVEIPGQSQPILHKVGMGGIFRVDPKPKEPAKPKPDAGKEVAKNDKPAKPLSRLEELRLEAQKEAEKK